MPAGNAASTGRPNPRSRSTRVRTYAAAKYSSTKTMTLPINLVYPSRRTPRRIAALLDAFTEDLGRSHPL